MSRTCVTSDFRRASSLRMSIVSRIFSFSKRSMSAFKTWASCVISASKYLQKCDIFMLFARFCTLTEELGRMLLEVGFLSAWRSTDWQ